MDKYQHSGNTSTVDFRDIGVGQSKTSLKIDTDKVPMTYYIIAVLVGVIISLLLLPMATPVPQPSVGQVVSHLPVAMEESYRGASPLVVVPEYGLSYQRIVPAEELRRRFASEVADDLRQADTTESSRVHKCPPVELLQEGSEEKAASCAKKH